MVFPLDQDADQKRPQNLPASIYAGLRSRSSSQITLPGPLARLASKRQSSEIAPERSSSSLRGESRAIKRKASAPPSPMQAQATAPPPPGPTPTATQVSSGSEKWKKSSSDLTRVARPSSLLSLPVFRKKLPRLYYPSGGPKEERLVNPEVLAENPKLNLDLIGEGSRSNVFCSLFKNDADDDEMLAIKIMMLNENLSEDQALQEYNMLRSFNHNHIIAAVGAYRRDWGDGHPPQIGILLYPVAPSTLHERIQALSRKNERRLRSPGQPWRISKMARKLLLYFRCLTHAVLYLHRQLEPVKHKDIKPKNILIDKDGTVFLADFDNANKYPDRRKVVSEGQTPKTVRYAAKAVVDSTAKRGFDRDIVSLGFVFLEMATVIFGETIPLLDAHLRAKTDANRPVASASHIKINPELWRALENGSMGEWIDHLKGHAERHPERIPMDHSLVDIFLGMILRMMKASLHDQDFLKEAYGLFTTLCGGEECELCEEINILEPEEGSIDSARLSAPSPRTHPRGYAYYNPTPSDDPEVDADDDMAMEPSWPPLDHLESSSNRAVQPSLESNSKDSMQVSNQAGSSADGHPPVPMVTLKRADTDIRREIQGAHEAYRRSNKSKNPAYPRPIPPADFPSISKQLSQMTQIPETKTEASSMGRKSDQSNELRAETGQATGEPAPQLGTNGQQRTHAETKKKRRRRHSNSPLAARRSSFSPLDDVHTRWVCMLDPRHDMAAVKYTRTVRRDCLGIAYRLPRRSDTVYRKFKLPGNQGVLDLKKKLPIKAKILRGIGLLDSIIIITHSQERLVEKWKID